MDSDRRAKSFLLEKLQRKRRRKRTVRRSEERKAKALSKSKTVKSKRERKDRRRRLSKGLCTRCGKYPPKEGRRRCDECSEKGLQYMTETRYRQSITEDDNDR
jgi:hypothetical protein